MYMQYVQDIPDIQCIVIIFLIIPHHILLFPSISYYFISFPTISAKLGTTKGSQRNTYNDLDLFAFRS